MVQSKTMDEFIESYNEIQSKITRLADELKQQCLQLEIQSIDFKYLIAKEGKRNDS